MKSVYSAVRTGSLNKAVCASYLKANKVLVQEYTNSSAAADPDSLDIGTRWRYIFARTPQVVLFPWKPLFVSPTRCVNDINHLICLGIYVTVFERI